MKSEQAYPETFGFSSLFHGHLRKVTEIKGLWGKMRVGRFIVGENKHYDLGC